jgi:hypothetical protein
MIKGKEGNLLSRLKFKVTAVGGGWRPTRAKLGTLLVSNVFTEKELSKFSTGSP